MMKIICLLAIGLFAAQAAPTGEQVVSSTTEKKEIIPVLKFETDKKPDGSFRFLYEGGDRSYREESGVLENAGTEDEALEVSGSYRYYDADGQLIEVHYTAGKNGFVPVGTNILSEITALAKAAADLPDYKEQEEAEAESRRKARSKTIERESDAVKKVDAPSADLAEGKLVKDKQIAEESKIEEQKIEKKDEEKVEEKKADESKVNEQKVENVAEEKPAGKTERKKIDEK